MTQDPGWAGAHGGAPYGGPAGWGPAGWGAPQPQTPEPGVIPLRPLQLGDILGGAMSTVGRYWKQLLGTAAVVYGGAAAALAAALGVLYASFSGRIHGILHTPESSGVSWEQARPLVLSLSGVLLAAGLLSMVCTAMVCAACATVLQEAVLGRPTTFRAVWRKAWSRLLPVIGTVLLCGLVVLVPLLVITGAATAVVVAAADAHNTAAAITVGVLGGLALVPSAVWLWVRFSLAPAAVVFEGQGPAGALRRSARLVRGSWWRVCGISLLALAIGGLTGYFIQIPFTALGMFSGLSLHLDSGAEPSPARVLATVAGYLAASLLGQTLSQIVSVTFSQLVTGLLYVDRRMRQEELAPVLIEAAARQY
ncbi:hypothetical protein [Streptomyces sp. NBC_00859]|uniref:DUF7847 domain-containing protein n=1 Tax=Streptomyces sp. NBC_00859 TaxID=2903682 RepID=UPI00386B3071|nr:hypothetical protein OG584_27375 [Streptomyces sp. NBC_00859]